MSFRKIILVLVLAGVLAAGWFGWHWYTTPVLPEISLAGADAAVGEAVQQALQEIRRQPQSGAAWGQLGMVLAANGFHEHVPRCYVEAARFEPDRADWPYLHAVHLLEINPSQAVPLLQKSLTLTTHPEELAAIHFRMAQVYIESGQLEQADSATQALRELDPQGPRLQFVLGLSALARGDRNGAREHLSGLTEVPFIKKRSSMLLASLVDEEQSRILQKKAARMPTDVAWPDPLEERMTVNRVDRQRRIAPFFALQSQGRHQEALAFLRDVVAESPDREVCFIFGFALLARGQYEESEKVLRTAIRLEPNNVKTHLLLGECLLAWGEVRRQAPDGKNEAMELFRKAVAAEDDALALQRELGQAHQVRGQALKHLGRMAEAVLALRQAALIQPDSAETNLQLGEALADAGQVPEALTYLQLAVQFARPGDQRPSQALEKWRAKSKSIPPPK